MARLIYTGLLIRNLLIILNLILTNNFIYCMDLELCLDQFDIHHNMIIRTEESLAIGGIFLQSTRLDTENECRRLCCETEKCDVYIFEEKNESYCYLFSCGPPENFKCKFTKHANFTSAVLIPVIRYSTTTSTTTTTTTTKPTQIQQLKRIQPISQQELELTNLKSSLKFNPNMQPLKTTTSAPPIPPNSIKNTFTDTSESCGRFQFKCHSGECIGIYNACNGIPQCEDGSDEGPECTENNANTNGKIDNRITNLKQNNLQTNIRQYQPIQIPALNNREDPMSSPPIWVNRRPIQEIHPNMGGLQIPSNIPPNIPIQANNIYIPQPNVQNSYISKPEDHMIMMPPNMNWDPQAIQQLQQQNIPINNINNELLIQQQKQQEQQEQQQMQLQQQLRSPSDIKITQENLENIPLQNTVIASDKTLNNEIQQNQNEPILNKQQNEKLLSDSNETSGENTEAPKMAPKSHNKKQKEQEIKKQINDQQDFVETYPYHEEYRMEFKDHDGYSERPSGAIISLVLGLLVTACLAILIGCKMRTVGRRRVRIKGSFNDADFLVNGMYL